MKLKDKVVLITGAAVRVGRGLAEALAAEGCSLVLHCNRSESEAGALARKLRRKGCRAVVIKCDLLEPQAGEKLIKRAFQAFGRLDALVNNAAVFEKECLAELVEDQFRRQIEVNLLAPVLMTAAFAGIAGKGGVINILDRRIAGIERGLAGYLLSKKSLAAFTEIAALELAPDITVNAVAPGPVLPAAKGATREKAGAIPLERRPTICDVAEAVIFLLKAEGVTGQIIYVDGGQHLAGKPWITPTY